MSSNLMDTEPGGRSTQYESIKTVTNPTAKEPGQLGHGAPTATDATHKTAATADTTTSNTHVSPAEKIRFGQAMSEQGGVSGYTAPAAAGAGHVGGAEEDDAAKGRRAQGYGGAGDMDREVGA